MKLKELADHINLVLKLSRRNADLTVCIPNKVPYALGSPTTTVKCGVQGMDWTNGKFLIIPENDMVEKKYANFEKDKING